MQAIYDHAPDAVLTGNMGRAAIYSDFNYEEGAPLPLRDEHSALSGYRDLDFLFMPPSIYGGFSTVQLWHPHAIDVGIGNYIQRGADGSCTLFAEIDEGVRVPVNADPSVIRPVTRKFLGVSVLTLAVGSQQQVERLMPRRFDRQQRAKYERSAAALAVFADSIRNTHPEEFLDDKLYAPFDRVAALRIGYC